MKVHFISIGGVAMHNLAIALHINGDQVTGSDDGIFDPSYSRLKKYGLLPPEIGWFPENINGEIDAVILGMHAKPENPELLEAQRQHIRIFSYPEFLYEYSKDKIRVVIGGSHGKTTITSMIVHVLNLAGLEADYMVGAQLEGFEVMVRLTKTAKYIVLEGDEYPTSPIDKRSKFRHYHPHIAVLSGIAWDHVDEFPTFNEYLDQFRFFIQSIEPGGCLFYHQDDVELVLLVSNASLEKVAYSAHPHEVELGITKIRHNAGNSVNLKIFGLHNMANLAAAQLVCQKLGVKDDAFFQAISTFKGASKRLELLAAYRDSFIYRDFAHAPSKVKATVSALRMQYPAHRLIICLELQCYTSMCETMIDQYKGTLDQADDAIVFYDPKAAVYKKIPVMSFNRIKTGFDKNDLRIFSENDRMLVYLHSLAKDQFILAFLTCGRFGGLDIPAVASEFQPIEV